MEDSTNRGSLAGGRLLSKMPRCYSVDELVSDDVDGVEHNMAVDDQLQKRENTYRDASRTFDYFVTGLCSLLFFLTALFLEVGQGPVVLGALDGTAIVFFAISVVAGVKKLEYYVAVLGTDYSLALVESSQTSLTVDDSMAVLDDLHQTIDKLTFTASLAHRLRNWFLGLGILAATASKVCTLFLG